MRYDIDTKVIVKDKRENRSLRSFTSNGDTPLNVTDLKALIKANLPTSNLIGLVVDSEVIYIGNTEMKDGNAIIQPQTGIEYNIFYKPETQGTQGSSEKSGSFGTSGWVAKTF
jgi:hypothetical protein